MQSYNNQPFYLRFENKVLSSSSTGYVIIPKLNDGNYQLTVGFAKNQYPEQIFNIAVKGNAGYELKNFPDKGWGLFDLQTAQVIMGGANTNVIVSSEPSTPKKSDAFADMLSTVVKDSTIRVDDSSAMTNNVSKQEKQEEKIISESIESAKKQDAVNLYTEIKKITENISDGGLERIYVDNNGKRTDTIRVLLPGNFEKAKDKIVISESKSSEVVKEDIAEKPKVDNVKPAPKFIEDDNSKTPSVKAQYNNNSISMINSDCKAVATEEDFLKLRKKMAGEKTDDNMIAVARKAFKSRCYNTAFIKNLSVLFLTDQGRYSFLDAAYPFSPDCENFPILEKELSDPYYITRFRAMIHK
ncbi:MAG: hypothetical protein NVSMB45_03120 [Ginsengibacter sp.]